MIHYTLKSNIARVSGRIVKLPNKFEKHSELISLELAKYARKSAKLRAPVATGTLKKGIDYRKKGKKTYILGVFNKARRYAGYIERGYRPHWIPTAYIELHYSNPGKKGSRASAEDMYLGSFAWAPGRAQPFLSPALSKTRQEGPRIARSLNSRLRRRT